MGSKNCPETPRQKMIGMMYLFLTAMLALNVSSDILAGFTMVEASLRKSTEGAKVRNQAIYLDFEDLNNQNPTKVGEWLKKANDVKVKSDSLYNFIQDLKYRIVKVADGKDADINNIQRRDNLDAAGQVTIVEGRGNMLKKQLDGYVNTLQSYIGTDTTKINLIKETFSTSPRYNKKEKRNIPWVNSMFEMMPVAASVTILSKIQNDIRNTEAEVVQYLKGQVDAGDIRVNRIDAFVIPESKYVIQGGTYTAHIVLAATDSTAVPEVFVDGAKLANETGEYKKTCSSIGTFKYSGYIRLKSKSGIPIDRKFESEYIVGAPSVTVSADLMNVFYSGFDNPVSISVPGIASANLNATITNGNGTITRKGNGWFVRPARVGQECVISVNAKMDGGKMQSMGSKSFRVKMLPPPIALIKYRDASGNLMKYKGGKPIAKADLINQEGLIAELDDADLDVDFRVLGFDLNITDALGTSVEPSSGAAFSAKQMEFIRRQARGKKFFLSRVRAIGPDGIERILPPVEVIVN